MNKNHISSLPHALIAKQRINRSPQTDKNIKTFMTKVHETIKAKSKKNMNLEFKCRFK